MKEINVAVCDDDKAQLNLIAGAVKQSLKTNGIDSNIYIFSSPTKLLNSNVCFSLVFLDIEMPELDGIECGKRLREKDDEAEIIYVSSREDRVFDSFQARTFGFVRKTKFLTDINEVVVRYAEYCKRTGKSTAISLKVRGGIINVEIPTIEYIEGSNIYQLVHVVGKEEPIEVISRMEILQDTLKEYGFMRIHKGYLVNYIHIIKIERAELLLKSGKSLPISRRITKTIKQEYFAIGKKLGTIKI